MRGTCFHTCVLVLAFACSRQQALASGRIIIGWASTSITPSQPVALDGQVYTRIAKVVHDPVTATALALETKEDGVQAIMVSCDLVLISEGLQQRLRERIKAKLPGFDVRNLFLNATHTHTAPTLTGHLYAIPREGVMQPGRSTRRCRY